MNVDYLDTKITYKLRQLHLQKEIHEIKVFTIKI